LKSQPREEDLVIPGDRDCCHPGVGRSIEGCGSARGAWREGNLSVGSAQIILLTLCREGNCRVG
jgi:hypothetical protein